MYCKGCGYRMAHVMDGGIWWWVCGNCLATLLPVPTQRRMPGA